MGQPIWMRFSELSRPGCGYLMDGSTTAESPKDKTWPKSRSFSLCLSLPWLLVLPGYVTPFWKAIKSCAKG